ncbi:MAG TPA: hypothetical protein VGG39_26545 [Polyangiaceae bacterium]
MRGIALAVLAASGLVGVGCGLSLRGQGAAGGGGTDAATTDDAPGGDEAGLDSGTDVEGVDGSDEPASACSPATCPQGACCGSACVPSCASCEVGGLFCPSPPGNPGGTCITSCAACATFAAPVGCFACGAAGLEGRCAGASSDCPADLEAGACPCPGGTPEECPGPDQVCSTVDGASACLTP